MNLARNENGVTFVANPFGTNQVAQADGFYLSFNEAPGSGIPGWGADDGGSETALVFNDSFLILRGDHREAYLALIPQGVDACAAYFRSHPELHSSWCSGPEADHD